MKKGEFKGKLFCKRKCCRILNAIKIALQDKTLDDYACFQRIEEIVQAFENQGKQISYRHDF